MSRYKKTISLILVIAVLLSTSALTVLGSNNYTNVEIPEQVYEENFHAILTLSHTIEIHNVRNGIIRAVYPDGSYEVLGAVGRPATTVGFSAAGFWAAYYTKAQDGTFSNVIASATNNFHMKFGPQEVYDPIAFQDWNTIPAGQPRPWIPRQVTVAPNSELHRLQENGGWANPQNNIIYTNIQGGESIFGGAHSPYVGNPIEHLNSDGEWESLDVLYYDGDFEGKGVPENLRIRVYEASTSRGNPVYFEFENWAANDIVAGVRQESNGRVLMRSEDGSVRHIADLIQRVQGTGRFGGIEYAHHGAVRASHPGVLCLSTTPRVGRTYDAELRGGFQFLPANHAKYLNYNLNQNSFINRDQWGIIAHVGATRDALLDARYVIDGEISYNPIWEGVAPLFTGGFLNSRYVPGDRASSTFFMVSTDFGATWHDPPEIWATTGLNSAGNLPSLVADWTNIRVYVNYSEYTEFNGTNPNNLARLLEEGDVVLTTPHNLGIFQQHSPIVIPEGRTLTVRTTLNVQRGATLVVEGALVVEASGRVNNQGGVGMTQAGTIVIAPEGSLRNFGYVENVSNSTIRNYGSIVNHQRFEVRAGTNFLGAVGSTIEGSVQLNIHRNANVVSID